MFVTIFAETPLCLNVHRVLVDVPTSSRVVKGRAGIWRRRWSLVPYPVNAAGRLLDPLAEVNIKRAGEIAGCWGSWIWCRKESRVLKVRVCKPFPSVPQGTPISLPRLRPGDDGQPNAIPPRVLHSVHCSRLLPFSLNFIRVPQPSSLHLYWCYLAESPGRDGALSWAQYHQ